MRQIFNFNKSILSLGKSAKQCSLFACLTFVLSTCLLPNQCIFAQTNFQEGAAKIPVEVKDRKMEMEFPEFDDEQWDGRQAVYDNGVAETPPATPPIATPAQDTPQQSSSNIGASPTTPLSSFSSTFANVEPWLGKLKQLTGSSDIGRMVGSLALVLGLYFGFVWVMRKLSPSGSQNLPREVLELIGQIPFGPKRNLQLIRLGSKLLLIINSAEGSQAIGEITDPNEVEYLVSLCGGRRHPFQPKMRPAPAPTPVPATAPPQPSQSQAQQQNNLASILRTLDLSAHSNNSVFEA